MIGGKLEPFKDILSAAPRLPTRPGESMSRRPASAQQASRAGAAEVLVQQQQQQLLQIQRTRQQQQQQQQAQYKPEQGPVPRPQSGGVRAAPASASLRADSAASFARGMSPSRLMAMLDDIPSPESPATMLSASIPPRSPSPALPLGRPAKPALKQPSAPPSPQVELPRQGLQPPARGAWAQPPPRQASSPGPRVSFDLDVTDAALRQALGAELPDPTLSDSLSPGGDAEAAGNASDRRYSDVAVLNPVFATRGADRPRAERSSVLAARPPPGGATAAAAATAMTAPLLPAPAKPLAIASPPSPLATRPAPTRPGSVTAPTGGTGLRSAWGTPDRPAAADDALFTYSAESSAISTAVTTAEPSAAVSPRTQGQFPSQQQLELAADEMFKRLEGMLNETRGKGRRRSSLGPRLSIVSVTSTQSEETTLAENEGLCLCCAGCQCRRANACV